MSTFAKWIFYGVILTGLIACPAISFAEGDSKPEKDLEKEVEMLKEQVDALMKAAEVRQILTETEEEKKETEENILRAAGRQYTLMQKGKFGFEYQLAYSHFRYDALKEASIIEHNANHVIRNNFILEYPFLNNLTFGTNIPFIYEYDQVGTDDQKNVTDLGDVSFYANYQPLKTDGTLPAIILNSYIFFPTGKSPYEINPDEDLASGSGGYSARFGVTASKALDPVLVYGGVSYDYRDNIDHLNYKLGSYTLDEVDPGDTIGFSMGFGFALSYQTSLTIDYSYYYSLKTTRHFKEIDPVEYPTTTSSSLTIGTSWRISEKRRVNVSVSEGLSNSGSHSVAVSVPMEFDL